VNGKSSSTAPARLLAAADWQIDEDAEAWLRESGQLDRLGESGLRDADAKWRSYRAAWGPRSGTAWAADWRDWINREHTPAPERPHLRVLSGAASPAPGNLDEHADHQGDQGVA
jgi:hypothetical protein